MTTEEKPVIFQGSGYRVIRNDPRNVKLQVKDDKDTYRDKGYFQTIEQALSSLVMKDLIVDHSQSHDFESYFKAIEATRKIIIDDITRNFNTAVEPEPVSLDDDDLF